MSPKSAIRLSAVPIFILILFFSFQHTSAYDEYTTHPALTDEIVDFYNSLHPGTPLTSEEKEWIVYGSILEDTPPRWINHFYDPVTNVSWTGEHAGNISPDEVLIFRALALSPEPPLTAVEWVNNHLIQDEYSRYGGDRTWKRALRYYADGNAKEAYITLGQSLHLLEDMTVPEHTRNDPHAHAMEKITGDYGSPYEEYTEQWTRDTLHLAEDMRRERATPPSKASIEDYLISVAEYSNHYFFSKDTINDPKNLLPKIIREDGNFGYGIDEKGIEFPLVRVDRIWNKEKNEYEPKYVLEKNEPAYYPILDAYFSRLSRAAVVSGAGVIDLFLKQARDAAVNKEFPRHLVTYDVSIITPPVISLFGELVKAWNAVASLANRAAETAQKSISFLASIPSFFRTGGASISSSLEQDSVGSAYVPENERTGTQNSPFAPDQTIQSVQPRFDFMKPEAAENFGGGGRAPDAPIQKESIVSPSASLGGGGGGGVSETLASPPVVTMAVAESSITSSGTSAPPAAEASSSNPYHFRASYVSSSMAVFFDWNAPTGTETGSGTARYAISELSGATSTIIGKTTSTSFSKSVDEVGVSSTFLLAVFNDADVELTITSSALRIPIFLHTLNFYRDPRGASSSTYLIDIFYPSYPFIPPIYSQPTYGDAWQGLVFYLNRAPNKDNQILTSAGVEGVGASDDGAVEIAGMGVPNYPVIFGLSPDRSNGVGGGLNNSTFLLPSEDGHLAISPASSTNDILFSPSDYITVAYYDFSQSGGGHQDLRLVAVDDTKYYFEGIPPPMASPDSPAQVSAAFDSLHSKLDITWASSTDPDSPDASLTYQFQVATSSAFDEAGWLSAGQNLSGTHGVVFGNTYTIGVRAADDFGNMSAPSVIPWRFPDGFTPLPAQIERYEFIGRAGDGLAQKIRMQRDAAIDAVALWAGNEGGPYCCAQSYLEILSDEEGIIGDLLATSTPTTIPQWISGQENAYMFENPIALEAGVSYWIAPMRGPSETTNGTTIFGSAGDAYPDGFWSDNPAGDAYFRLREAE